MIFSLVIVFLLLNLIPAMYFGKKYWDLKKIKASDDQYKILSSSMMKCEGYLILISLFVIFAIYLL